MNSLIYLLIAIGASAGIAAWQQQSIERLKNENDSLAAEIRSIRKSTETEQHALAQGRSRLNRLQSELQLAREERRLSLGDEPALPGPEQEGWWPQNRPYFYLPKASLQHMHFRDRIMSTVQLRAEAMAQLGTTELPEQLEAWLEAQEDVTHRFEYRLFEGGDLHSDVARFLGMTGEEVATVNELYRDLIAEVRRIEAAHIKPITPPETLEDGRLLVAQMPSLIERTGPVTESYSRLLEQTLGESRGQILRRHAEDFINEHLDGFGSAAREFLYRDGTLWIRYRSRSGSHSFHPRSISLRSQNQVKQQEWEYGHLFGPGAPCNLE